MSYAFVSSLRKSSCIQFKNLVVLQRCCSATGPQNTSTTGNLEISSSDVNTTNTSLQRDSTISKAMSAYLTRAKEHQEFIDKEEREFVFGRRHLANMMGKDPETFSQKDINEAIRYLFPSGLYEPRARPMMKPPQEIYPKQKAAQFDMSGRPHHPFFYTAKPNYFYLLHEMIGKLQNLNNVVAVSSSENEADSIENELGGSVWISKPDIENRLLEKLSDTEYSEWRVCMERLVSHPNRSKEIEFIHKFRKPLSKQNILDDLPLVEIEPNGLKKVFVGICMRKSSRGEVTLRAPGTGEFNINGKGLDYFRMVQSREQILFPLLMADMLGQVDVEASVRNGGESSQAGCLRWGIAQGVAALGADIEKLRLAGLLTRDLRKKERNKPGQDGARAKWTWKKR